MVILGISEGPGASAAVVVDGAVRALVHQWAVDRRPRSDQFPSGAIDAALDHAGLRARDVGRVVCSGAPPPLDPGGEATAAPPPQPSGVPTLGNRARALLGQAGTRPKVRLAVTAALRATGLHMVSLDLQRRTLVARLAALGLGQAEVSVVEEDRCQIAAAYLGQGADHALVLLLDEARDGAAVSVAEGQHGQIDRLSLQTSFAPICGLLQRVGGADEPALRGIDRALADNTAVHALLGLVGYTPAGFRTLTPRRGLDAVDRVLLGLPEEVRRASAVVAHDRAVVDWARARHQPGLPLCLAGTAFRRPELVRLVREALDPVALHLAVDPGAGAAALGAALLGAGGNPSPAPPPGFAWSDQDCYRALSNTSLPRDPVASHEALTQDLLAGRAVARFVGALPPGDAPTPGRGVWSLDRGAYALVSPRVAARLYPRLLAGQLTGAGAWAFDAGGLRARCPGLVRPDGSALLVLADEAVAPVLDEVYARRGVPAVGLDPLGNPLAASPADAIDAWRALDGAALHLGPYRVG